MHQNAGSNPGTGKRFPFVKSEIVLIFDSYISGEATCLYGKLHHYAASMQSLTGIPKDKGPQT